MDFKNSQKRFRFPTAADPFKPKSKPKLEYGRKMSRESQKRFRFPTAADPFKPKPKPKLECGRKMSRESQIMIIFVATLYEKTLTKIWLF